jgi:HAD superfamily hydrolase (TIGR01549 family)
LIRAVIFDVGGPLDLETAFEAAIDAGIRAGLAGAGFAVDDAAYADAERWAVERFAPSLYGAVIWRLTGGEAKASQRVYDAVQAAALERSGLFELREGIGDVLEALKQRGLKLGLAANQPAGALAELGRQGIGHYFANPGISAVYGYRKPDVRLFLRACEDLGVAPHECVMVGDRVDNDVVPARSLGMRTVLLRAGRHAAQQPRSWDESPDVEVLSTPELLPAILSLLDGAS